MEMEPEGKMDNVNEKRQEDGLSHKDDHGGKTAGEGDKKKASADFPLLKWPTAGKDEVGPVDISALVEPKPPVEVPANNEVDSLGNKRMYVFEAPVVTYYRTYLEPDVPRAKMQEVADVVERWVIRAWREFFGVLRIVTSFFIIALMEGYRFFYGQLIVPSLVKVIEIAGSYVLKPLLTTVFNNLILPIFVFVRNVGESCAFVLSPPVQAVVTCIFQTVTAFRLISVNIDQRRIEHADRVSSV